MLQRERTTKVFEGVNAVLTTPFLKDGSIDEQSLRTKVRWMIEEGIAGSDGVLVPTGSTGECHVMTLDEYKMVAKIVMEEAAGRAKVVVGTNRTSTAEAIELAKYSEKIGADGIMNLAPFYWKPEPEAIFNHYRCLNDAIGLPILVYNNMYVNQVDIDLGLLERICDLEHVVAVKECTPSLEKMERVVRSLGSDIEIINGRGELTEPYGYLMGTKGYVSIIANYAPKLTVELHRLGISGQYKEFFELKARAVMPMLDYIGQLPPSHEAIVMKKVEEMLGIISSSQVRAPYVPLNDQICSDLKDLLVKTGMLEK
jgi:4-hydroxy-tetrahydrodipicolinate synthase